MSHTTATALKTYETGREVEEKYYSEDFPEDAYDFESEYSEDSLAFEEESRMERGAEFQRISRGDPAASSTNYLDELDEIQNNSYLEEEKTDPAEGLKQLNELLTTVDASHLPASVKMELTDKIREQIDQLKGGKMEDSLENVLEDLNSYYQSALEENPSIEKRIVQRLAEGNVETTETQVEAAMKKYGFTEDSFTNLVLPGEDKELLARLMNLFKEVNPNLAQTMANDPEKGFSAKALGQLKVMINSVYPTGADLNLAIKIVDETEQAHWDNGQLKNKITGEKVHYDGDYNNRFYDVNKFSDILYSLSSGQSFDLTGYLNGGRNAVDNGARNKGIEVRKFLTGLFDVAESNPYLFRHYLQQLPETALLAMKDVLDYRGGGGNDPNTKFIGERWDTTQASNILGWAVNGGVLPSELQSEKSQEIEKHAVAV